MYFTRVLFAIVLSVVWQAVTGISGPTTERWQNPLACRLDDHVRCVQGSVYICSDEVCDGHTDCPNGEDEDIKMGCTGGPISRSEVISRAKTWSDVRVPYSQTGEKDGFRTDCSGYVSMAWALTKNYNTRTLRVITIGITKNKLAAGDILLRRGVHVTIFDRWANSDKSKYWGYEESSSKGAIYRRIPYPYFDHKKAYFPRRYNLIKN